VAPHTTGLELLEWIGADERYSDIPVIMLSSSNERRYADRAFALGARRYVFKPTGFQSLVSTVRRVLYAWLVDRDEPEEPPGVA